MNKRFEQLDLTSPDNKAIADSVSDWSSTCMSMKFYSSAELKKHPLAVAAKSPAGELLGHVAVTEIIRAKQTILARIGALAINEDYYGHGIATGLIKHVVPYAQEKILNLSGFYAYVHNGSAQSFTKNGFDVVGIRSPASETGCDIIVAKAAGTS